MHRVLPAIIGSLFLAGAAVGQDCVGCTPLTDLGPGLYLGLYEGGLYPSGANVPPAAHRLAARTAAAAIVPRDMSGAPAADGWIGSLSISMSNVNQEFSVYERDADLDPLRNARIVVMNGAQGGQAVDLIDDPTAVYWDNLGQRLAAAGLSPPQVQVVWLKMALAAPSTFAFPDHALEAEASAVEVVRILKSTFPNLSLCFFSSRIYGGYSIEPAYGEPLSYETGFAVKWLIESQIDGDPGLNFDPGKGPVVAPLLLWGPYLWANGTSPRADGLDWIAADMEEDGAHPSARGEAKVAAILDDFYSGSQVTRSWYRRQPGIRTAVLDAVADAAVSATAPDQNFGADPILRLRDPSYLAFVKFDIGATTGFIERAKLSFVRPPMAEAEGGTILLEVSDTGWEEGTITFNSAPPLDGPVWGVLPFLSRGTAASVDVTAAVQAAQGGLISFAFTSAAGEGGRGSYLSREGGGAPRLVLTLKSSGSASLDTHR